MDTGDTFTPLGQFFLAMLIQIGGLGVTIAVDTGDTFTPLGQFFLAMLIQIGGLGVTSIGVGIMIAIRQRVDLKGRRLIREAMNVDSGKGLVRFVKAIFLTTITFELVGIMIAIRQRVDLKGRRLIREAMNVDSGKGLVRFVKAIFLTTITFELVGAVLSFPVFARDFPLPKALGISLFHSVAAFNNSGFDNLGGV